MSKEKEPFNPDEDVPIGREEIKPDPEKDTIEIKSQEIAEKRQTLIKAIDDAKNIDGLCNSLKENGYGFITDKIYEAGSGLKSLIKSRGSKEDLEYTLENLFKDNEDLFKGMNLYDEEFNKKLREKVMELLMKEANG